MVRLLPVPWVCQMMPPSRRRTCSCAARTPKYWLWRQSFLIPASKTMKSWISSRKRSLPQSWIRRTVERILDGALFLPGQVILLRRLDRAVAQPLGVVARHDELHGREEGLDEDLLLVVEVLADALGHRDRGALQLQHAERDAVDVEHDVRALAVGLGVRGRRP